MTDSTNRWRVRYDALVRALGFEQDGPKDEFVQVSRGQLVTAALALFLFALATLFVAVVSGLGFGWFVIGVVALCFLRKYTAAAPVTGGLIAHVELSTADDRELVFAVAASGQRNLIGALPTRIEQSLGLAHGVVSADGLWASLEAARTKAGWEFPGRFDHTVEHNGDHVATARIVLARNTPVHHA